MKERYQDVNKNEIKFIGKTWVTAEYNGISTKLPMLITKRNDITPLLGVNWLKQLPITKKQNLIEQRNQPIRKCIQKIPQTLQHQPHKDAEVKIQIKPGCYPIQQKARPIPYHLQEDVKNELNQLIEFGHSERLETIEEDCFVSPVVTTVKKDKSAKIALDARKLNDSCIKKKPHMPNMDELLNQISAELSKNDTDPIWISVIDLDYAYGQMELAPDTSKHCNFAITGEKNQWILPFPKRILRPSRHTHNIPREDRPYARTRNTRMVGRYHSGHTGHKRKTHPKIRISTHKT